MQIIMAQTLVNAIADFLYEHQATQVGSSGALLRTQQDVDELQKIFTEHTGEKLATYGKTKEGFLVKW